MSRRGVSTLRTLRGHPVEMGSFRGPRKQPEKKQESSLPTSHSRLPFQSVRAKLPVQAPLRVRSAREAPRKNTLSATMSESPPFPLGPSTAMSCSRKGLDGRRES